MSEQDPFRPMAVVAKMTGVSRSFIFSHAESGKIPSLQIGNGPLLFRASDVLEVAQKDAGVSLEAFQLIRRRNQKRTEAARRARAVKRQLAASQGAVNA